MALRVAGRDDARACCEANILCWRRAYAHIVSADYLSSMSVDERAPRFGDYLVDHAERSWVVEVDGQVVGFVSCGPSRDADEPGWGEVYAVYVHPDHWGHGHGRALMEQAERYLAERRLLPIRLWVFEANDASLAFYAQRGYRPDGGRKCLRIGDQELPVVRLILR